MANYEIVEFIAIMQHLIEKFTSFYNLQFTSKQKK